MNPGIILFLYYIKLLTCENAIAKYEYFPHFDRNPPNEVSTSGSNNRKSINRDDKIVSQLKNTTSEIPVNIKKPKNSVLFDEIPHYVINKKNRKMKQINRIETEFRNLLAMKGLKYNFKRDQFWRSWRKVSIEGNDTVIFYKCENSANFTNCHNGGYWVIEEKPPPCPYELFSLSKESKICAIHLNKYYNAHQKCSMEISVSDLSGGCNNPIETEFRILKIYNSKVPERFPTVICGGRQNCRVLTLYNIASTHISFRIVNIHNKVIYSRVMKDGKKYACLKHCGIMDPETRIISKSKNSLFKQ